MRSLQISERRLSRPRSGRPDASTDIIFIFGSFVSRDVFWAAEPHSLKLTGYYARTSLATAFGPAFAVSMARVDELHRHKSSFQRQMVGQLVGLNAMATGEDAHKHIRPVGF